MFRNFYKEQEEERELKTLGRSIQAVDRSGKGDGSTGQVKMMP